MATIETPTYKIRFATPADVPQILSMIHELAEYEHAAHEVQATEEKLRATLEFPTTPPDDTSTQASTMRPVARCLLIEPVDSSSNTSTPTPTPAGMALYFHNYSTWQCRPGIYVEDLFVRPDQRRRGFGGALLRALARECVERDLGRLEWSVLRWNVDAIRFYTGDAVGARSLADEWMGMRVEGERLERLAGVQTQTGTGTGT